MSEHNMYFQYDDQKTLTYFVESIEYLSRLNLILAFYEIDFYSN